MTAADQTPATERVEQIRARVDAATSGPWAVDALQGGRVDSIVSTTLGDLRWVEVARSVDADTAFIAHSRDDIPWLLNQLAEQAATIERVAAVHRPVPYGSEKTRSVAPWVPENVCDHCLDDYGGCVDYPCATIRALGSQRTEGQG